MADSLAERLLRGDKRALARGISLVEDDDPAGWDLVKAIYPHTWNA
jgi:LAO/AO transport system kinase